MTPPAAAAGTASHADYHSTHNPWATAIVATLGTFMEVLDTTIVNVALPHVAGTLGADVNDSTWVLTAYLVSNAIILPLSAYFASLIGRRNFYLLCMVLFTGSSALCGLAPNLPCLVFFRLLQGIGGGGLQPTTQAILIDTFPPRQRGMGMALFGMTVVAAPIIGPTLGGWLTDNMSWRWVFLINIPVGILSLVLVPRLITDPPYFVRRRGVNRFRFDYAGLGLLAVGLGALQLMLDLGERHDWFESRLIMTLGVVMMASLITVVFWEWYHKDPAVNLHLLKDRNLAFSTLLMGFFGFGLYGSTVLLPLFMQTLIGYTSLLSGLALSPGGILILVMMPMIGMLVSRVDVRIMIVIGTAIITGAMLMMSQFYRQVDFSTIVEARLVQSFGMAFIFVPVNTIAYAYIAREHRDGASSLMNLARNIGGSIGIAYAISLLSRRAQVHQTVLTTHTTAVDPATNRFLAETSRVFFGQSGDPVAAHEQALALLYRTVGGEARMLALVDVFQVLALVTLLCLPLAFFMRRPPKH